MVSGRYRFLAWASCVGMFFVLFAGALVTNTGSGRGCGDDWPLCKGKFIPAYTFETVIELSHRLITGLVGIVVVATFVYTLIAYRKHKEAIWYSGGSLLFTIVQAIMGAAAVIWHQSDAVMAIHFGISLIAVAFTVLLVLWTQRINARIEIRYLARVPAVLYKWVWVLALYCYAVVYLGAYIRHTDSGGGCLGWPLCNGEYVPEITGATGIVFLHRLSALLLFFLILGIYLFIRRQGGSRSNGLQRSAGWLLVFAVISIFSGAFLTWSIGNEDWFVFTNMLHNVIVTGLFAFIADMSIRSFRLRERKGYRL